MEMFIGLIFMMVIVAVFLMVVLNEPFWQGYRNSKFIDEMMKEEDEEFLDFREIERNQG
ncbi:hypothetical protein [Treponema sp. UBA3813]|uniref:hypothetical protein n=1 Tax=Treponema sp. UBA3813 TaxID=1947715 RepID=UPI0025F1C96C|nr:hypothetical protein [Treponema sp. UBA3813]